MAVVTLKDGRQAEIRRATPTDAAGLERVTLHANASNARALALYGKVGFVQEGLLHRALKDGDRYDDVVIMALLLQREPSRRLRAG